LLNLLISYYHHYPGLPGCFQCRNGLYNNSEIIFKLTWPYKSNLLYVEKNVLLTKQTQVHAEKKSGAGI